MCSSNAKPWSIQAEVTISHQDEGRFQSPVIKTESLDHGDGVRMTYTWKQNPKTSYGFQRGNMLFTSTPGTSGYNSDLDRPKCKSTCSIVLSSGEAKRTQSLRCQRHCSRSCSDRCGDPWCYHSEAATTPSSQRYSPIPELSTKKDAECQTIEMQDQCTSPMFKMPFQQKKKIRKRILNGPRNSLVSSSETTARAETVSENETQKKSPRTVHIDVYCTGSEADSSSIGSDDSESEPVTVFESDQMRLTHNRVYNSLPRRNKENLSDASLYPPSSNVSTSTIPLSSITPSDSFEYADSIDKFRIQEMENLWRRAQKKDIVNETTKKMQVDPPTVNLSKEKIESKVPQRTNTVIRRVVQPTSSLLSRAQVFGKTFGNGSSKLGHHIGPVRNPVCTCEHCVGYYNNTLRSRTRSVGDAPEGRNNWKQQLSLSDMLKVESKNPHYSDF